MMTCRQPITSWNTPFPTSLSTSAINSSATGASILSGTAWRRNLARLSKKWKPNTKQSHPVSGTVAAAATEKLIRRPQMTIQTEDLTASQFAHMAGIKIKRGRNHEDMEQSIIEQQLIYDDDDDIDSSDDDTEDDDDGNNGDANGMLSLSLDYQQIRQLTTKSTKTHQHHGSIPCMTSYSTARYHPIWDVRFWQQQQQQQSEGMNDKRPEHHSQGNNNNNSNKTVTAPTSPVGSMLSSSSDQYSDISTNDSLSATDTCLSNTISSTSLSSVTSSTSSTTAKQPRVFHKGRFQIVLGDDDGGNDDTTTLTKKTGGGDSLVLTTSCGSSNNVREWHRKRTMTH